MPDRDAAMAVLAESGWNLLLAAGLAFDDAARDPLRAAALLAKREPAADAARRAAALELVTEGAKLGEKLGVGDRLLAVRGAVEQASAGRVATWHAQRLPDGARVLEIGCGCGGDSLALAHRARNLVATDVDPVRAACAHMNLAALGLSNARAVPGDGFDLLAGEAAAADVVFVDPDRRPGGERTLDPEAWAPPLSRLARHARADGRLWLVKAAPSLDADAVADDFHATYVSHDGACVEAFLASRTDRSGPPRVAAVRLPRDAPSETLEGDRGDAAAGPLGDALFVPDPAAVRARLLRELCTRHRLALVGDGIAWMTGSAAAAAAASPWLRAYRVVERCGVGEVPAALRRHAASGLRVHVRGVAATAADLERDWRRALSRDGDGGTLDVFVSRFLGEPAAVLARD